MARYKQTSLHLVVVALSCVVVVSCQNLRYGHPGTKVRKEIVEAQYDKSGVKFSFPAYWTVTEDKAYGENERQLVVADLPFSFVRIRIIAGQKPVDLRREVENVDSKIQPTTPRGEGGRITEINRTFQGQDHKGLRLKESYSDKEGSVGDTTDFFLVQSSKAQVLIILNADDADWNASDKEFQLLLDSLKVT